MPAKTFLPTVVTTVRFLCKFIVKHRPKIEETINGSGATSEQKTIMLTFLTVVIEDCAVFESVFG